MADPYCIDYSEMHADTRTMPGFCARWFSRATKARGLWVMEGGEVLVLKRDATPSVVVLHDDDNDGVSDGESTLLQKSSLSHSIVVHQGHLYASSSTTVWRWPYTEGQRSQLTGEETVVFNMDSGGHSTRTLVFDAAGLLYISVGSASNVDADSSRSRIRRFSVADLPAGGLDFQAGEVFADGLRNEVGLAFDAYGVLWGVENGSDNLDRTDLGGDIHNDNPAEELNRFPESQLGETWGYPYCWSEFSLPAGVGRGRGTVWAYQGTMDDGTHSDAWCSSSNPPAMALQAHSAPLGIAWFDKDRGGRALDPQCTGAFPDHMHGDGTYCNLQYACHMPYAICHVPRIMSNE
jgi:glucose/arabinose dehydrogenase